MLAMICGGPAIGAGADGDFAVHDTRHFRVLHLADDARAAELGEVLESMYLLYFAICRDAGFVTRTPVDPLTWLFFSDAEAYRSYMRDDVDVEVPGSFRNGYYCTYTDSVLLLHEHDFTCEYDPDRPHARIAHEAAHQLAYHSGLQTRGVMYPVWISEGLAMHFETADGFGGDNPARRNRLIDAHQDGRLRPLDDFLVLDRMPADEEVSRDLYAQAWGFVRFLFEHDDATFRRYLYTLGLRPQGRRPAAALRREFTRAFGSWETISNAWQHYLDRLSAVDTAKAESSL